MGSSLHAQRSVAAAYLSPDHFARQTQAGGGNSPDLDPVLLQASPGRVTTISVAAAAAVTMLTWPSTA